MLVELVILPIIQKVVGTYISDVLRKRSVEKTRADMVTEIRRELLGLQEIRDEVTAMKVAIRELDLVVKKDALLGWRESDDALVIIPQRKRLRHTTLTPELALRELASAISKRRQELGLPELAEASESTDLPTSEAAPAQTVSTGGESDPDLIPPPPGFDGPGPIAVTRWRDRVAQLVEDTARERRTRSGDDT